ncbi:CoA transferase [Janibacter sp. G1551]|uniref:CoA transferase n=1 Tax=Janibacter sp. G1551 TaxID=3420440 RepID=UPI003CFDE67B
MTGPLEGLTAVSIAINLPGPAAMARLVGWGARGITVLPPTGDPMQHFSPDYFDELHVGQELVTADLKTPEGQARLHELLDEADLLVTSSRPSALARLGLDEESLATRHPRLSRVAIIGHAGDEADVPGHDLTYQASAGLLPDAGLPRTLVADLAGAERAAAAGLAAVIGAARDGRGHYVEVALADAAYSVARPLHHGLTAPGSLLGGGLPGYGVYATADGRIALGALEPHLLAATTSALGVEASEAAFEATFASQPTSHWLELGAQHGLPIAAG